MHFPNAIQMVDGYPAEKHLEAVACVAFSTLQQQQARLEAMRQALRGWMGRRSPPGLPIACQALLGSRTQKSALGMGSESL
jgi:uncharacterized protein (DUF305 family)